MKLLVAVPLVVCSEQVSRVQEERIAHLEKQLKEVTSALETSEVKLDVSILHVVVHVLSDLFNAP